MEYVFHSKSTRRLSQTVKFNRNCSTKVLIVKKWEFSSYDKSKKKTTCIKIPPKIKRFIKERQTTGYTLLLYIYVEHSEAAYRVTVDTFYFY